MTQPTSSPPARPATSPSETPPPAPPILPHAPVLPGEPLEWCHACGGVYLRRAQDVHERWHLYVAAKIGY